MLSLMSFGPKKNMSTFKKYIQYLIQYFVFYELYLPGYIALLRSKQSPNDKHINVQFDEDELYIVVFLGHLHYT